jgi:exonuclease III
LTWNCNGAFRKKFELFEAFKADILIIQECEDPSKSSDNKYKDWANNSLWTGENKNRGLGIFAKPQISISKLDWPDNGEKYFIPCRVNDDFNLLGVWCHGANSPTFGYIGQMWKYLQINKLNLKKAVIAGDFNSNVIWDKWDRWWNHSDVVRELKEFEIESIYHEIFKEIQGQETQPTFYLTRKLLKPYHIDYIFASRIIMAKVISLEIGNPEQFLARSDHMPIMLTIRK